MVVVVVGVIVVVVVVVVVVLLVVEVATKAAIKRIEYVLILPPFKLLLCKVNSALLIRSL